MWGMYLMMLMSEMYLCINFPFLKGAIIHRSGVIALCEAYGCFCSIDPSHISCKNMSRWIPGAGPCESFAFYPDMFMVV